MTYSQTLTQLTHLLQTALRTLGAAQRWTATGGSTTTFINTDWHAADDDLYEDNDPALVGGTIIVQYDAGGAGAAPEGQFSKIASYDSATQTITFSPAVTAAIASGDKVLIVSPDYPLEDMIDITNVAVEKSVEITKIDTSLSVASGQTEYSLPAAIRERPVRVQIQTVRDSNDNQWRDLHGWEVRPAAPGSAWTLVIPRSAPGLSLAVWYRDYPPRMEAYDSPAPEVLHRALAEAAVVAFALEWYNTRTGGTNQYYLQRENKAWSDYAQAKVRYMPWQPIERVSGFPHWEQDSRYVPGTSDLME